jgi:hypothetical protein
MMDLLRKRQKQTASQPIRQTGEKATAKIVAIEVFVAIERLAGKDKEGDSIDVQDGDHQRSDHDKRFAVAGDRQDGTRENVVVGDNVEKMESICVSVGEYARNCT